MCIRDRGAGAQLAVARSVEAMCSISRSFSVIPPQTPYGSPPGLTPGQCSPPATTGPPACRDMPEEQPWALTAARGIEEYFDWQRLRHEVLEPLRAGRPSRYRPYRWLPGGGLDEGWVTVDPTPICVLEGVYTARPQLRDSRRRRGGHDLQGCAARGADQLFAVLRAGQLLRLRAGCLYPRGHIQPGCGLLVPGSCDV